MLAASDTIDWFWVSAWEKNIDLTWPRSAKMATKVTARKAIRIKNVRVVGK